MDADTPVDATGRAYGEKGQTIVQLGTYHPRRMRHVIRLALVSAVITLVGTVAPSAPAHAQAPAPLTLTQTWLTSLNDAPCGLATSSPVEATLNDGVPSVEVGDVAGDVYAFHIGGATPGASPPGWSTGTGATVGFGGGCGISGDDGNTAMPAVGVDGVDVPANPPVNSTASVWAPPGSTEDDVFFGGGNSFEDSVGGYYGMGPSANLLWDTAVQNPPGVTGGAIQASPAIGVNSEGTTFVNAGSIGQETYSLNVANGSPLPGWPAFTADAVFSTAAVGDLYGTGQDEEVVGGASTAGFAYGTHYQAGGHLRIFNDHGGLICEANPNEEVDSSPAVGPILPGGAMGIAVGTGVFYPDASDKNTVKVFNTQCGQIWSTNVGGNTGGSPALADLDGNGQLDVVEGTITGPGTGSVVALNATTGAILWQQPVLGEVIGGVATADLANNGTQDVIVGTTGGLEILDGATGDPVASVDDGVAADNEKAGVCAAVPSRECVYGFQNTPLVTDDPDGLIGITVAGYSAVPDSTNRDVQGMVQHFTVDVPGSLADATGGWPQFHHDPQLSGFTPASAGTPPTTPCQRPPAAAEGYNLVATDGGIFSFSQAFCGSTGNITLNKPVVGMAEAPDRIVQSPDGAPTPNHGGYWLVASDGGVFAFDAPFYGSMGGTPLNKPIVGMAATPDGNGYWLVASDGGIFTFGDARYYGSVPGLNPSATLKGPIVGMAVSPDGLGYWEVSSTGQVFAFGDAGNFGDASGYALKAPIVGMATDNSTGGYWLVGADGGIFSFGAHFYGSTGNLVLNKPIVGMTATDDGHGYWFVAADGGIFSFGDAPFKGSTGNIVLNKPVVGMVGF
jgi:hypothetical protein